MERERQRKVGGNRPLSEDEADFLDQGERERLEAEAAQAAAERREVNAFAVLRAHEEERRRLDAAVSGPSGEDASAPPPPLVAPKGTAPSGRVRPRPAVRPQTVAAAVEPDAKRPRADTAGVVSAPGGVGLLGSEYGPTSSSGNDE